MNVPIFTLVGQSNHMVTNFQLFSPKLPTGNKKLSYFSNQYLSMETSTKNQVNLTSTSGIKQ